jgi:uncharacterized surface protein with fasciclin (FAS1) repeats
MKPLLLIFLSITLLTTVFSQEEMPASILELAKGTSEHTMIVAALYTADLVKTLSKNDPITLFAPGDEAFRKLKENPSEILGDPNLASLLQQHIVAGKWTLAKIIEAIDTDGGSTTLETLSGQTLRLTVLDGNIILNDSVAFVTPDLEAEDGIIHSVDGVLFSSE